MLKINKWSLRACMSLIVFLFCSAPLMARVINVRGTVTDSNGNPLYRVSVFKVNGESQSILTVTNEDGKFTAKIDSEGSLAFSCLGYEDQVIPVNGRLTLDVKLIQSAKQLDEVVIIGKGKKEPEIVPEKSELDIRGDYVHFENTIPVPEGSFSTDNRVIVQPILYNVTRKDTCYMIPKVANGPEYALTQERMLDFDLKQDTLTPFLHKETIDFRQVVVRKDPTNKNPKKIYYINYHDSVFVKNKNDDYRCVMIVSVENYNRVLKHDTTEVARGIINPLRHLEFGFSGAEIADSSFFPQPEPQLRDTQGDVNLIFKVNKSSLDLDEGNNRAELLGLREQLQAIENDPDAKLNRFVITGTASPEGTYAKNKELAKGRMAWAMSYITQELSESTRRTSEISTVAEVERWESVVEMLRADGLDGEADAVQAVIDRYPNDRDRQSKGITSLPFYRKVLIPKYLPRLRRVSYELSYSQYRTLSDEEVDGLYNTGKYKEIPRYDFWKLYRRTDSIDRRIEICRKALEIYPKFLVAANDLAAMLIDKGEDNPELLEPYLGWRELPDEVRYNQVAAYLLGNTHYSQADSLAELLPDEGIYHKAKIYAKALNGKYKDVIQEISESSPINEVVMLLAVKENDIAWKKAQALGNSAKEDYLRAIAANRLVLKEDRFELCIPSENFLKSAIAKDPSLRDLARVDGDLMNLLKQIEEKEKDNAKEKENIYEEEQK